MNIAVTEELLRIVHIAPEGRIDAFSVAKLREKFEDLLDEEAERFVVDLSETTFLDSAGMAALVSLLKRARQAGGDVMLVWPKLEAAQRILKLTKFDRVFTMLDRAEDAVIFAK